MGLRRRQRVGQYRIEERLAAGGFAEVFRAYDTVQGIRVAIKVPHDHLNDRETMESFRREVRLVAPLDHPNILPIKTAGLIDGHFMIVAPLGIESLADRLKRRMSRRTVLSFAEQLFEALAYAHKRRVIHCDVKPDNLVLFPESRLKLADFGLARIALRSIVASGSGTVGYLAPEQALGKPSPRSDVFSAGLILYRLMSGELPDWPFQWPYPGIKKVRRMYGPGLVDFVRKATWVDERKRFGDAVQMLRAYRRIESTAIRN